MYRSFKYPTPSSPPVLFDPQAKQGEMSTRRRGAKERKGKHKPKRMSLEPTTRVAWPVRGEGGSPVVETLTQLHLRHAEGIEVVEHAVAVPPAQHKELHVKEEGRVRTAGHGNCPVVFGLCQNGGVPAASISFVASAVIVATTTEKRKNGKKEKKKSAEKPKKVVTHNAYLIM